MRGPRALVHISFWSVARVAATLLAGLSKHKIRLERSCAKAVSNSGKVSNWVYGTGDDGENAEEKAKEY